MMANGRLPALATFSIIIWDSVWGQREGEGEGGGARRLGRAFEGAGGTLKQLTLTGSRGDLPARACYELGAAIGKLRRLRVLELQMLCDGRGYHAMARGLAASGGCPELFTLSQIGHASNIECLTHEPSLIAPSVRDIKMGGFATEEEALLLCCGLVRMGYKYRFDEEECRLAPDYRPLDGAVRACMRAILEGGKWMT
jgi:hypothetical protein